MGTGVGEAALIGAALGAGGSAITGGDPLKGALIGGLTGGAGGAFSGLGAAAGGAGAAGGVGAAGAGVAPIAGQTAGLGFSAAGFPAAELGAATALPSMGSGFTAAGLSPELLGMAGAGSAPASFTAGAFPASALGSGAASTAAPGALGPSLMSDPMAYLKANKGLAGISGLMGTAMSQNAPQIPGAQPYTGPLSRFRYNPDTYRPQTMAEGGIASLNTMVPAPSPYARPVNMRSGGISDLGSYSDGGRLLKGPGDGMSDSIPATIAGKRPARLAEGEFVVPSDVVSAIGNGSTNAGARELYAMMNRVRQKRTGKPTQAKAIKPQKYMPA